MERFVVINIREVLLYWEGINPKVELTEERMEHIRRITRKNLNCAWGISNRQLKALI